LLHIKISPVQHIYNTCHYNIAWQNIFDGKQTSRRAPGIFINMGVHAGPDAAGARIFITRFALIGIVQLRWPELLLQKEANFGADCCSIRSALFFY
jgi:hypothetical protein